MLEELRSLSYKTDDWVKKQQDIKNRYNIILLDDVLYKDREWKKFDTWFMNYIKPFHIMKHDKNTFSVFLDQSDFHYDWVQEKKIEPNYYGDGNCYDDLFRDYLNTNDINLNSRLNYDSENGMFCIYCKNKQDAEKVCFELSKLYKDEDKMIQLIKDTKQKYNYIFDVEVSI